MRCAPRPAEVANVTYLLNGEAIDGTELCCLSEGVPGSYRAGGRIRTHADDAERRQGGEVVYLCRSDPFEISFCRIARYWRFIKKMKVLVMCLTWGSLSVPLSLASAEVRRSLRLRSYSKRSTLRPALNHGMEGDPAQSSAILNGLFCGSGGRGQCERACARDDILSRAGVRQVLIAIAGADLLISSSPSKVPWAVRDPRVSFARSF